MLNKLKRWWRPKEYQYILRWYPFIPDSISRTKTLGIELLVERLGRLYDPEVNLLQSNKATVLALGPNLVTLVLALEKLLDDCLKRRESYEARYSFNLKPTKTYLFLSSETGELIDVPHYLGRLRKVLTRLLIYFNHRRHSIDDVEIFNLKTIYLMLDGIYQMAKDLNILLQG